MYKVTTTVSRCTRPLSHLRKLEKLCTQSRSQPRCHTGAAVHCPTLTLRTQSRHYHTGIGAHSHSQTQRLLGRRKYRGDSMIKGPQRHCGPRLSASSTPTVRGDPTLGDSNAAQSRNTLGDSIAAAPQNTYVNATSGKQSRRGRGRARSAPPDA